MRSSPQQRRRDGHLQSLQSYWIWNFSETTVNAVREFMRSQVSRPLKRNKVYIEPVQSDFLQVHRHFKICKCFLKLLSKYEILVLLINCFDNLLQSVNKLKLRLSLVTIRKFVPQNNEEAGSTVVVPLYAKQYGRIPIKSELN